MEVADQVISIFAVNEGFADGIELHDVARFENGLIPYINGRYPGLHDYIMSGKKLGEEQPTKLRKLISDYTEGFRA